VQIFVLILMILDMQKYYTIEKTKKNSIRFLKYFLSILLSTLVVATVVRAGTITPPGGAPAAKFYTITEIYNFIAASTTATEGTHDFTFSNSLSGTGHTLTEIYNALAGLITANKVKFGTTYLGVAGSLTPDGGTAGVTDLFNGQTANLTNDWVLDTGTLNLACNTATFDGTGNLVADAYDGAGNGTNRWCMTNSGTAVAADMLSGKVAWINGIAITGSATAGVNVTGGNGLLTFTVPDGLYTGSKTATAADTKLVAGNIKKATSIFGTAGSYSGYPGTGWTGTPITQAACDAQQPTWYWFEDANGDGTTTGSEDGICVKATLASGGSWNGSMKIGTTDITAQAATNGTANSITKNLAGWTTNAYANEVVKITGGTAIGCWGVIKSNTTDTITVYGSWLSSAYDSNCGTPDATSVFTVVQDGFDTYDNSWIGDWTCTGSFPNGTVVWGSFPTTARVGAATIALAMTDCYDGQRDLLPTELNRAVVTGTATAADATSITDTSKALNVNGWVGQKVLITGGTGVGGSGRIESNNAISITVSAWAGGTPALGSTFAIVYLIPHADLNPSTQVDGDNDDQANGNNGPLNKEVLKNWKGTRLPTFADYFGYCGYNGNGIAGGTGSYSTTPSASTADKSFGNQGGQVGRTDEWLNLNNFGGNEWLSEQYQHNTAMAAGALACSWEQSENATNSRSFRAVFRP
jgi:hypothetical protein